MWIGGIIASIVGGMFVGKKIKHPIVSSAVTGIIAILGYLFIPF